MRGQATLPEALILGGTVPTIGAAFPAILILRELIRFGVRRATLVGPKPDPEIWEALLHQADELPTAVELASAEIAGPPESGGFLLVDGRQVFDANVARLLAAFAADPPAQLGRRALRPGAPEASAGLAACDARALSRAMDAASLAALLDSPDLPGTVLPGWFADLREPAGASAAAHDCAAIARRPALFLDRDGVLNHDHAYVGHRDRWDWVDGAREAVRFATDHGWHVFIVTNQSGIARGFYTEQDAAALHAWVVDEIRRAGGTIDDIRMCPYLPDAPVAAYACDSDWRKPRPGMLLHLIRGWGLDPSHCVMVGDRASDAAAAAAAGMRCHLFSGGNLLSFLTPILLESGLAKTPPLANIA